MAKTVVLTSAFKRDIKKFSVELATPQWIEAMYCLLNDLPLPAKYCDHQLQGKLKQYRDCHIKPDLVLLYEYGQGQDLILHRLNTHSELDI